MGRFIAAFVCFVLVASCNCFCSIIQLHSHSPLKISENRSISLFDSLSSLISIFVDISNILNSVYSENEADVEQNNSVVSEDAFLNISELATKYGYDLENHTVTTEDGYILTLHRIPHGRNGQKNNLTVFLMHGLIDSSDSWVLQGPDKALAYVMADQGFDVWMGNARGNKHSLAHATLNITEPDFWQFTWEEIGVYDLAAMTDYVLNVTGKEGIYYIGHSQGSTSFLVLNSLRPEYNRKFKMSLSLAPVAWMKHAKSPIVKMFSPANKVLGYLLSNFNTYSPSTDFFNRLVTTFCTVATNRCDNILYMVIGNNYKHINDSMIPVMLSHFPSGSSTSQFVHFGQLAQSGRFCRYDFDEEKNLQVYGAKTPPDYNLTYVTVPTVLYYSKNDWFSDIQDVETLRTHLPKVYDQVYIESFNHLDWMYGSNASEWVYEKILSQIREFESGTIKQVDNRI